jgi:hypothetical protein
MAISTGDQYIASSKQVIPYTKTGAVTTIAATRFATLQAAGFPGAGTLPSTGTPAGGGALFTSSSSGMPTINSFGSGATGYLSRVQYTSSVAARLEIVDKIWGVVPTLTALATTTVTSPVSYTSRIPGGTDYSGLRMYVEITTTMAASATTLQVTYTNQAGATGKASGTTASLSGFTAGRWVELPLATGDTGVQAITAVTVGGATNASGAANIIIVRPLWTNRVNVVNGGGTDGLDRTGLPIVYATSALSVQSIPDSTSTGVIDMNIEIANN